MNKNHDVGCQGLRGAGAESAGLAEQASPMCLKWTGGTCNVFGCWGYRNATCVWDFDAGLLFGKCLCEGTCARTDGACHAGDAGAERVASNITLRSVRYDDRYLSVTGFPCWSVSEPWVAQYHIGKTITVTPEESKFPKRWDLYRVPGAGQNYSYMLVLVDQPNVAAGMFGSIPGRGLAIAPDFVGYDRDPRAIVLSLCRPRPQPEALEISNTWGDSTIKWCAKNELCVYGGTPCDEAEPGSDRWVPEPPIALPLPDCVD